MSEGPFGSPLLQKLLSKLLFGGGTGIGIYIAYIFFEVAKQQPALVLTTLGQWGALPVVMLVGMYFGNQRVGEFMNVMRENTTAQEKLANAVNTIANKDDRSAEELKTMMGYVGQQLGKLLEKQEDVLLRCNKLPCQVKPQFNKEQCE